MVSVTDADIHRLVARQTVATGFLGVVNRLPGRVSSTET
jgi:hypothetical protein